MNTINKNNSTHSQRNALEKECKTAIEVSNLQFSYTKESAPIIDIEAWQVSKGEHVFLSGPSGSGKSTLLNLLCGTLTPTQGDIALLEQPFSALSNRQRDKFRARNIGVVFQQFNLIPYLSVAQNINAAVYFAGAKTSKETADAQLRHLLDKLQLPSHVLHAKADALSIGQQQRVAIARALINDPQLLIVDEPTSALDTDARDSFMSLLKDVAAESTMIFVSHDKAMESYFDRHCSMSELSPCTNHVKASGDKTQIVQERA
ncbi:ABC transporter ATP-binding protein [Alteromonas portus]|uniref:ABC transporter ATP-binding protein n=1 Tax=Alteromonas portus TaxID=2565549 RepID=A0A4U0ZFW5_9ALTE|nr:ABC transporter ATP-binding protein [Alteromonas portus]TKB02815.1 ABC transporter ATP-binding protein [Alteromonas portus]